MNEIFITDASAVFAEKLTLDDTIIKGDKFYFGKLEQDFESIDNDRYDLRCNRVLKYLIDKLDLSGFRKDEIGIVIGTTNSGVEEFETTENKHHAELGNPAEFLKWYLGTTNYATCVSTACTSGAKAFSTARKLLENRVCKAVIVGGVDTLASMPSYGFHALEVLSHERTNPFSKNRDGISLGEGGALFVVVKAAEQLGSEAAKRDLDAKMPRGKEVKSVSEIKDDKTIRRKDDKYKTEAISRHSEALPSRKNPADTNLIQSQGIKINSTETDQASSHLGILASRQQNDVGIAMPTYKTTSNSNLAAQPPSCLAASCLPHSAPMVLIDEVLNVDMENQIVKTSVKIHDNKMFFDKEINGISPLVGIEFMAQTIGCYAYFKAGKTIPKIGFLLGTRQYENKLEKFENGKTYILTAREIYGDNELVSFECLIYNEGEDESSENYIAKATINAFQPKDVEKYIKELE